MSITKAINKAVKKAVGKKKVTEQELNGLRNRVTLMEQRRAELTLFENEHHYFVQGILRNHKCESKFKYKIDLDSGEIIMVDTPAPPLSPPLPAPSADKLNLTKPTSKFITPENKKHYEKMLGRPLQIGEVIDMESTPIN